MAETIIERRRRNLEFAKTVYDDAVSKSMTANDVVAVADFLKSLTAISRKQDIIHPISSEELHEYFLIRLENC